MWILWHLAERHATQGCTFFELTTATGDFFTPFWPQLAMLCSTLTLEITLLIWINGKITTFNFSHGLLSSSQTAVFNSKLPPKISLWVKATLGVDQKEICLWDRIRNASAKTNQSFAKQSQKPISDTSQSSSEMDCLLHCGRSLELPGQDWASDCNSISWLSLPAWGSGFRSSREKRGNYCVREKWMAKAPRLCSELSSHYS